MKRISLFFVVTIFVLQLVAQSSRYAESSVLSSGDWYKIQVEQSGIHKITYEQLIDMGIKNPANISVFGYGGAQLPEAFSKPYIDDLPQLSIYMEKGSDGVFGKGDYILFYAQAANVWKYNKSQKTYEYHIHPYSKYNYYYLTTNAPCTTNKRIISKNISQQPNDTINTYTYYSTIHNDAVNTHNNSKVFFNNF